MNHEQEMVLDFHRAKGVIINPKPTIVDYDSALLRLNLISEEFGELQEAIMERDLTAVADALGDLEYVVKGTAVSYGIDMEPVFKEIHESNMSKLGKRADGKLLKGGEFRPPDLGKILKAQANSDKS